MEKALSKLIEELAKTEDPNANLIWKFVTQRIEGLSVMSLYNLATDKGKTALTSNPFSQVIDKVLGILFACTSRYPDLFSKLKNEYARIEKLPSDNAERVEWTSSVFGPIALLFFEDTGLSEESAFCLKKILNAEVLFNLWGVLLADKPQFLDWLDSMQALQEARDKTEDHTAGDFFTEAARATAYKHMRGIPESVTKEKIASMTDSIYLSAMQRVTQKVSRDIARKILSKFPSADQVEQGKDLLELTARISSWITSPVGSSADFAQTISTKFKFAEEAKRGEFVTWLTQELDAAQIPSYFTLSFKGWVSQTISTVVEYHPHTLAKRVLRDFQTTISKGLAADIPESERKESVALIEWNPGLSESEKNALQDSIAKEILAWQLDPSKGSPDLINDVLELFEEAIPNPEDIPEEHLNPFKEDFKSLLDDLRLKHPAIGQGWNFVQNHAELLIHETLHTLFPAATPAPLPELALLPPSDASSAVVANLPVGGEPDEQESKVRDDAQLTNRAENLEQSAREQDTKRIVADNVLVKHSATRQPSLLPDGMSLSPLGGASHSEASVANPEGDLKIEAEKIATAQPSKLVQETTLPSLLTESLDYINNDPTGKRISLEYEIYAALPDANPDKIKWIADHFEPLAIRLLNLAGVANIQRLNLFDLKTLLATHFANVLFQMYGLITRHQRSSQDTELRIARLVFDRQHFEQNAVQRATFTQLVLAGQTREQAQLEASGANGTAVTLQREMQVWIAPLLGRKLQEYVIKYREAIADFIDKMFEERIAVENGLLPDSVTWLEAIVKKLLDGSSEQSNTILQFLTKLIATTFPKALVSIFEKIKELDDPALRRALQADPHQVEFLPDTFIIHILSIFDKHLKEDVLALEHRESLKVRISRARELPEEQQVEALRAIFRPIAVELLQLLGTDPKQSTHPLYNLPLPEGWKLHLNDHLLPDLLADLIGSFVGNMQQDPSDLLKELREHFFDKKPAAIHAQRSDRVRLLESLSQETGEFTRGKIPAVIATNPNLPTGIITAARAAIATTPDTQGTDALLARPAVYAWTARVFNRMGISQHDAVQALWKWIGEHIELTMQDTLGHVSKALAYASDGSPKFMLQGTKKIFATLSDHFTKLRRITRIAHQSDLNKIPESFVFEI